MQLYNELNLTLLALLATIVDLLVDRRVNITSCNDIIKTAALRCQFNINQYRGNSTFI